MRCAGCLLAVTLWLGSTAVGAEAPAVPPDGGLSAEAREALQLIESNDAYQREFGFLRLEALRQSETAPAVQGYLSHRMPEMRAYSVRALAAVSGAEAVPLILRALKTDRHPYVRRSAVLALEPFVSASPAIVPALLDALRDRNSEVRMSAIDVVSRLDDPRAREAILLRNRRERRRDVRRVLKLAMPRIGSEK